MSNSLAEALAVVEERLPREFFDEVRLAALDGWARNAPPVAWAGFECPLGANERWVDFHQGIRREDLLYLVEWLEKRRRNANGDISWITFLLKFCGEWERADSLFFKVIPNLIFEYDVRDHPDRISSPSLFLALEREDRPEEAPAGKTVTPAIKAAAIEAALALFVEPAQSRMLMRGIKRCLDTAIGNACVSHLGLMLARTTAAVRLNVRSLKAEQFAPYLKAIGWKGSTRGLEEVLADAFAFAERINLAIDVGQEVAIPIGLECSTYVHNSARWEKLLKHLVEASACTEEQHRSLQKWWGRESPSLTVAPWPSNLVIEGLLETPDRFGVIDRFLSHIKITWQSGATPKYKSYLGFTHHFLSKPKALEADSIANRFASPVVWRQVAHPTNELERAISGGIDFLLRNRLASGLWLDFPSTGADDPWLAFGTSDEWVSLYVAAVLGSFEREDAKHAASWVWRLLNHRRNAGEGWGYSCISPADADSTVWALRLAEVVDASHSAPALAAGDFLRRHQHQNGGFATYLRDAAIRYFADLLPSELNAWCEPHACVTAARRTYSRSAGRLLPVSPDSSSDRWQVGLVLVDR